MLKMGFDPIFVNWIMQCLSTASFSFNINGQSKGYITPSRGIRQGDPLSPYLFLICSEIFSHLIQEAIRRGEFHGLKLSNPDPIISHLLFADDSLIFCRASTQQAGYIKHILELYGSASGQLVNLDKSSIFFSKNTSQEMRDLIRAELQGVQEQRRAKYLGLPLMIGRAKKEVFSYITEAVAKKTSSWKNIFLSQAGKDVLLKSVIDALPVFTMSCLRLPKNLCKQLESLAAKFWWGNTEKAQNKLHWKSWNKLARPKEDGGIGFKDFSDFNSALLAKQLWRLITHPNLLMSKVIFSSWRTVQC